MTSRLIVTTGEPAGIGPDTLIAVAQLDWDVELVAVGCRKTLSDRAQQLGLSLSLPSFESNVPAKPHCAHSLPLIDVPVSTACIPGHLNTLNASHVLAQLDIAIELCRHNECQALVTGPVHKGVINAAGHPFSGHTEYLETATSSRNALMLLTNERLRVALATTHLPLRSVPDAISRVSLTQSLETLISGLRDGFGIDMPKITVLGLNPHAGEGGHMGSEETEIIGPVCDEFRARGHRLSGPISADTAFRTELRNDTDAYLAMFHDQGLPIIKSEGFGETVNVTLGLPIVRTSVDHGSALSLAGTGQARADSLKAAIQLAAQLANAQAAGCAA